MVDNVSVSMLTTLLQETPVTSTVVRDCFERIQILSEMNSTLFGKNPHDQAQLKMYLSGKPSSEVTSPKMYFRKVLPVTSTSLLPVAVGSGPVESLVLSSLVLVIPVCVSDDSVIQFIEETANVEVM